MVREIDPAPVPLHNLSNEMLLELYVGTAASNPHSEQVRHFRAEIARRAVDGLARWANTGRPGQDLLYLLGAFTGRFDC